MPPVVEGPSPTKFWGVLKDVSTFLVIPAFLWIIKLEVGNAQRDLLIKELQDDHEDMKMDIKEAREIDKTVQDQALKLAVLEGKLDTANGRLIDIQNLLRNTGN